jgi:predicted acetyltransferase
VARLADVELTFRTLDPRDDSPETTRLLKGWLEGLLRGFHDARPKPESWKVWLECVREDGALVRGAWLPDGVFGAGPVPVATYSSLTGSLNTGRRELPLQMITDVTVSPAHRRQGLLRRMITDDLADAVGRGLPLAALTVSETTIYGRFGFGLSSWRHRIEVDTRSRFGLRDFVDPGRVELAEPGELWPVMERNFAAFHERTRGSVSRPAHYRPWITGSFDFHEQGPNPRLRAAVHLDSTGEPDGHVVYQHRGYADVPGGKVTVLDLVAADPAAYLALWRFLADIDLCVRVEWNNSSADDPLVWALTDAACRKVDKVDDHIWVRVLDVVTALEGRPWGSDGSVVLGISDPLGHADGSFRVTVKEGEANVEPVADDPEVRVDAETLGALYLGGAAVATLAAAGRVSGSESAVRTWAAMADLPGAPFSLTSF